MPEETTSAVTTTTAELPNLVSEADTDAMLMILTGTAMLLILLLWLLREIFKKRRRPCEYCDRGQKILCRRVDERGDFLRYEPEEFYAIHCPICGQVIPKKEE